MLNLATQIIADADRCVLCGMCLPHCPTYALSHNEAESPRGRISLMLALARGQLAATPQLLGHLDRCLSCRACEAMCPSQVAYGRLLRTTRELAWAQRPHQALPRLLSDTLRSPARRGALRGGLRLFQRSGLQRLGTASGLFGNGAVGHLLKALPALPAAASLPPFVPARGEERGRVALFVGCTGDLFERALLHDAADLLSALGYGVHIPAEQTCCGALQVQQGDGAAARALAQRNVAAFAALEVEAVLTVASGCGALLHEYGELLESPLAATLAHKVRDIGDFLADAGWPAGVALQPLPQKVFVHEPCSLRNVLGGAGGIYKLLRRIPELEPLPLPHNDHCCGAAGSYFVSEPETADALRAEKIAALAGHDGVLLVSANIGCAMHLAAGIRAAGLEIEVLHPITLITRQRLTDDTVVLSPAAHVR